MNSQNQRRSLATSVAGWVTPRTSRETRELITLGRERNWDFRVLGEAPMLETSMWMGEWLLVPAHQDSSDIPARTLERVQAIFQAGLRPRGFVMVHEAPKLLPPPGREGTEMHPLPVLPHRVRQALKRTGIVVGALFLGLAVVTGLALLVMVAVVAVAALLAPLALVVAAVTVDPILVAVTEDGYWIEIDRWDV